MVLYFLSLYFSALYFFVSLILYSLSFYVWFHLFMYLVFIIVSESMLFFACFWSFINFRLCSLFFNYYYLLLFSSPCFSIPFSELIILVWSSLSLNSSFIFLLLSFSSLFFQSLFSVLGCGLSFIFLWLLELYYSIYSICDYFSDCIFFFSTSLHGLHVILGILGFIVYIKMSYYGSLILWLDGHVGYYLLSLYWHFVDFIWLIVFLLYFILI